MPWTSDFVRPGGSVPAFSFAGRAAEGNSSNRGTPLPAHCLTPKTIRAPGLALDHSRGRDFDQEPSDHGTDCPNTRQSATQFLPLRSIRRNPLFSENTLAPLGSSLARPGEQRDAKLGHPRPLARNRVVFTGNSAGLNCDHRRMTDNPSIIPVREGLPTIRTAFERLCLKLRPCCSHPRLR